MDAPDGHDFILVEDNDLHGYDEELHPQPPEVLASILKWLQPTDYLGESSEYKKHLSSYVAGTDLWIQETEAYHQWYDSPDYGALWTKAIAGAGKSVFAAMITAQLARTENVPVLFFFFRQIIATNHDPHSMARDWIAMTLKHSPSLQARMKKHMDDHRALENISTNEFWQDLVRALASLPKVYCVVDALDEMDIDKEHFLKSLVTLGKRKPSTIKLLMTSRPLPRIESFLKDPSILQIRLDQLKVDKDISLYVDYRLQSRADLDDSVRSAIKHSICKKSSGSFLYARLMMDEILDHTKQMIPKVEFLQRSLDWLPVTLEDMYNGMLLDHSLRSRVPQELQLTILQWVTHSSRPLRLLEIASMLDCQSDTGRVAKDTKAVVRAACGPLLEILEDETVSVIHHSFTEFLIDPERKTRPSTEGAHPQFPVIDPVATHNTMALACLKYLTSGCMDDWELKGWPESDPSNDDEYNSRPRQSQQTIRMRHPFLQYAMSNWYVHASKLENIGNSLLKAFGSFMTHKNRTFFAWLDINWPNSIKLSKVSPLHVASWAGMTSYVQYLLQIGVESNSPDGRDRTPLSWASSRGNVEVVALLLKSVSDPDVDDYNGHKPLHYAALANHHKIVKLLLAAGVSPTTGKTRDPGRRCGNARSSIGDSPLMYSCNAGSVESVREMMPYLKQPDLNRALEWAARSGKTEVVELLLTSPDTSVDHPDYSDTPLFLAASGLHFDIMRSLLKRGADPNKRSVNIDRNRGVYHLGKSVDMANFGPTPLHAVCGGCVRNYYRASDKEALKRCFHLLLEAGCDINAVDTEGKTPLHHSVALSEPTTPSDGLSQLLLENGANAMAEDKLGNTPLHLVPLRLDSTVIVEALMSNGADITKRNNNGQTPIHTMLDTIHGANISCVLPYVSDWNIQDSDGNTPLHIVFSKSYDPASVCEELLDAGADLGRKNKKGEAPIHVLRDIARPTFGREAVLSNILKAGADLNMRDNDGRTVLLRLLSGNVGIDHKSIKCLLEQGAEISVCDFEGNGVLHLVCKMSRDKDLIQILVDAGADPLSINHAGNTPLHELLNNYASCNDGEKLVETVKFLLKLGVPAAARNNIGQTALHLACGSTSASNSGSKIDPFEFVLDSEIGESLNTEDNHGVRPIHLAATVSEQLLARLIERGADSTAVTYEGKNLLHITARTRNPNSIGLLLEHFSAIGRTDLINARDFKGRTALHEACRSGRPESVALLVKADADVNMKDKGGLSPLYACAEFEEENLLWTSAATKLTLPRCVTACGILESDPLRPEPRDSFNQLQRNRPRTNLISIEDDTVRVREIIQLLIDNGADIASECAGGWGRPTSPFSLAVANRVSEMVDELLPHIEKHEAKPSEQKKPSMRNNKILERHLIGMTKTTVLESDLMKNGDNSWLCENLLAMGQYSTIEQLPGMGVDLLFKPSHRNDFFTTLAQWGYASLLETLGATISQPGWVNGKESAGNGPYAGNTAITPYIITAAKCRLPNLDVLKVLIEKFNADVNIQQETSVYEHPRSPKKSLGASALHIFASGNHWWYTAGLEYLLQHGANLELKNEKGKTPLHVAVGNENSRSSYHKRKLVQILLQHGANPNAIDNTGATCLNSSMHDVKLVRLLVKYGADITYGDSPALFSAITAQDVAAVAALLEAGADCNVRQKRVDKAKPARNLQQDRIQSHEYYPIHYAANAKFNSPKTRESAIQIIKLLLDNDADPFLNFRQDAAIIYDIFEHGGILQPFLDLQNLDLERQDPNGRTLLLAAARSRFGTFTPSTLPQQMVFSTMTWQERQAEQDKLKVGDPLPAQTVYEKGGNLLPVDNEGNNVLHFLSLAAVHNIDEYQKTFSLFIKKAPSLIHQKNTEGWTPFHHAVKQCRMWNVETLLNAGADPLDKDPEGNTPLHHLALKMSLPDAEEEWAHWWRKFISLGVSINAKNNKGETAAFVYFQGGSCAYYEEHDLHRKQYAPFEEAGADVFTRNNEGETLLHVVATKIVNPRHLFNQQKPDVPGAFKFLMEKGLDPMAEDNSQRTALDVAAACGNADILALFQRDKSSVPVIQEVVKDDDW